jgi:hypothetical protein
MQDKVLTLPRTLEEYTMWALEFSDNFHQTVERALRLSYTDQNDGSATALLRWIEYTLKNYPELITVDLYYTSIQVWVCGVYVNTYESRIEVELVRDIIDEPRCTKRTGRDRKRMQT